MNYIDQAIQDVKVLQAIKLNGFTVGSHFRAKQLNEQTTHSGSIFGRLCRMGVLKIAEKGEEKITVKYTENVLKDPITGFIFAKRYDAPREIRNRLDYEDVEITKEVISKFNIYEVLVDDEDFALESYKEVMQQCERDVFVRMSHVQKTIAEIYKGYNKVQDLRYEVRWARNNREWEERNKRNNN